MKPSPKITSSHLSRSAIVYVRQSTLAQVRVNTESTTRQYGLTATAAELGWLAEQIVVIDADLGMSGRFGSERDGFRDIVARICMGEVGAVFGLEVSRFGRSNADLTRLMELARLTDTLLIDADGVYDLGNVNDRLLLGLKGQMSEIELHFLMGRLHGAKLAAAQRGELRHPLPVGLVYDADGDVIKDPDEQIQGAITDLFAEFHRGGSALAVMRAFDAAGRLFPQRTWGGAWAGTLKWGKLTHARVLQALKNPAYAGAYTFGRSRELRRVQPDGTVRSSRRKRAREDWTVTIQDHHEGYISWQEYLDIEVKLAANNTQRGARPAREGTALCQGIISCGVCGGRIGTRYDRGDARATYTCQVKDSVRTPQCRTVVATTVDAAVSALFLDTITAQQITIALAASDEVTDRRVRSHRAAELAVQRARYEAERAERAFTNVEPENRLVARSLESRWETKLAQLADAEAALATAQATSAPAPAHDALRALAADLPRLWDSPTTSHRDRKRLLRSLIADITLLPTTDDSVRIGVRWHTGATDELTVLRHGPGRTPAGALELVRRYGATHSSEELAERLNAAGLLTGKGKPFTAGAVARVRDAYKIWAPRTVAIQDGEVSVKHAAAELGIPASAVYNWLIKGQVPARRAPGGRWCIPWNPETRRIYRQKVAGSFRLKPHRARRGDDPGSIPAMIQPVIFDLYHTLIHGADDERDRVVAEMAVMVNVAPDALVAAYHDTWRDRMVRWTVEETIRILSRRLGADPSREQVARAGEHRRALARRVLATVPAATLDALDSLRADGHRLALISNATSDTAEAWSQSPLAERFDVVVFSCEVGVAKPDPAIYLTATDRLGADPANSVYVGDGADGELAGATAVGLTTLRITELNDTDPDWQGPTLAAIGDLPALLRHRHANLQTDNRAAGTRR